MTFFRLFRRRQLNRYYRIRNYQVIFSSKEDEREKKVKSRSKFKRDGPNEIRGSADRVGVVIQPRLRRNRFNEPILTARLLISFFRIKRNADALLKDIYIFEIHEEDDISENY